MESGRGGRGRGRGRGRGNYGGRGSEANRDVVPHQQATSRADMENTSNNSNGSPWFGGGGGSASYKGVGSGRGGMAPGTSSDRAGVGGAELSGGKDGSGYREMGDLRQ